MKFVLARLIDHHHTARPVLQVQDCVSFEPEQDGEVLGHQVDPKQQQDAPERRVVPLPHYSSTVNRNDPRYD